MSSYVLASASPRRKELLTLLNFPFAIHSTDVDESIPQGTAPENAVQQLAFRKAAAALEVYPDSIIFGSDTIVVHQGRLLGKPSSKEEAFEILSSLSGKTHEVYTGVCILSKERQNCFYEKTEVTFWDLSEQEITSYIASGEPFDKAGAYGIQGRAALFVKSIAGDYYNVVGLPVSRLARELSHFG